MPAAGLFVVLLFGGAILGTIGLWYAIDRETADTPRMDRADAERVARQDTADADSPDSDGQTDDEWGGDGDWGVDDDRRQ